MGEVAVPSAPMRALFGVWAKYTSPESRSKGVNFKPSSTDVIVTTAPKSGTTWVQQICHGLRSGGNMDFDEISLVFPCLEMAHEYGYTDLQAPQPYSPRMYKTHLWQPNCPKGASKYIVVVRQPSDTALSLYHFLEDWAFKAGDITIEEFIEWTYLTGGAPRSTTEHASQCHHILSWYPYRLDNNVLWLHYEDLQQNLRSCVRLISDFLQIGSGDEKLQELVAEQATFEFMKKHAEKFDEHPLKLNRNEAVGLARDAGLKNGKSGKVRQGSMNASRSILPQDILGKIDQKWKTIMGTATGYESYDEMRTGINKELGRIFLD